jgi:hypothetical protein
MATKRTSKRADDTAEQVNAPIVAPPVKKAVSPIDQHHLEPGPAIDDPGDLEKETLDASAPFNKTYGQEP